MNINFIKEPLSSLFKRVTSAWKKETIELPFEPTLTSERLKALEESGQRARELSEMHHRHG